MIKFINPTYFINIIVNSSNPIKTAIILSAIFLISIISLVVFCIKLENKN